MKSVWLEWLAAAAVLAACSDPGEGGGVFGDTTSDADTRDAVLFPEIEDAETAAPEVDTAQPETVDTAPPIDTAQPETVDTFVPETVDTTPADTAQPETVDTAVPETTTGPCTYHTDCYPERVCGLWVTTNELRCSEPCAGDSDCIGGQICSKLPGSVQVGFCQDAPAGQPNNIACTEDAECRSRLCADGKCAPLCMDEAHCAAPGNTCHPTGDLAIGLVTSVCSADPAGVAAMGQECTPDGFTYDSSFCASGHCDLLNFQASTCAALCKSEADCAPAQECNMVLYAPTERPDAVPYDPLFTQKTHDAVSACYSPLSAGGFLPEGSVCNDRSECRSNKCLGLLPGSQQTYCTSFCTSDAQCPATMACKLDVLNLSSEWLAAANNQAPGSWTFVRICKFR